MKYPHLSNPYRHIPRKTIEGICFITAFIAFFCYIGSIMGASHMLNTLMNTAHDLLLNTVFYLMGVVILSGAISKLFHEFGVVYILQAVFGRLMRPVFRLPGVAVLGPLMAFLSDNPVILSLSQDRRFASYFRKFELISFINFGTAFGMGLIVVVFMLGKGYALEPFLGLLAASISAGITTIIFQKILLRTNPEFSEKMDCDTTDIRTHEERRESLINDQESYFIRFLNALLDGGKGGVTLGLTIAPGVIIISTLVFILTFGPSEDGTYTGEAYQGIELLPLLAGKIGFVFDWLFGFKNAELIAFPITSLGAVGAALGQIPRFIEEGLMEGPDGSNAICVFTAMGISWSGFFSTYSAIFDAMGWRNLTTRAIAVHFFCGLLAGVLAHWLYLLC